MHTARIVMSRWTNVIQYVKKGLVGEAIRAENTFNSIQFNLYIVYIIYIYIYIIYILFINLSQGRETYGLKLCFIIYKKHKT